MPATAQTAVSNKESATLTGRDFVERAIALRPHLIEEQAAVEKRTRYSPETFQKIRELGLYKMLQPRMFDGYEIDLPSYFETVIELARGCPSSAWSTTLAAGHPYVVGAYYPEDVQAEFFGPENHFIAPLAGGSRGVTTKRVEGGWIVNGTWVFCSGVPYATHFQGFLAFPANEFPDADKDDARPVPALMTIKDGWEMLEDWGDLIGLKGSGSNSVKVTDAFVPDRYVVPFEMFPDVTQGTIGAKVHGNALFATPFHCIGSLELPTLATGMVHGMLDEFRNILLTRKMPFIPLNTADLPGTTKAEYWYQDPIFQQAFGKARARVDSAKAIILQTARTFEEKTRAAVDQGEPFGPEDIMRIYGQGMMAAELAWEAAEIMFKNGSSSAARDGQRMQRYWRDICAFRSNGTHQFDHRALSLARASFGMPANFF
jgi:3-hydroxy-9,10-secoandrosta-1,3,5(10)-triene-9,17-dione monooxygenase